ncbi:MAG TPA: GNAT family N-acetyltransferase [Gaiellaceae bacterium]|nr:GNAT family N-acetyltransferase [Gaiellaceae bacterium]
MTLEYRNPAEDELRATFAAANVAFANELRDDDFELQKRELPTDRIFGAYDDGHPVGLAASIAFEMTIPGGPVPCGGVTYVGVMPSHRRQGVLTQLMRAQLDDLHARGEPLAALWASEPVIYGRFGYGIASPSGSMEAEKAGFAFRDDPGPTGRVRLLTKGEARELYPPVYERARLQRHGMMSRSEARWDARVNDPEHWRDGASPKFYVLFELDGQGEGFAMYRIKNKWERGMPQSELMLVDAIATSTEATRELWRFIFNVDLVAKVSFWNYDPATPLFLMVRDARRLQLKLGDGVWLRLVDVGEALRRRSYEREGGVVLEVTDVFCPWNEGRYRAGEGAGPTEDAAELRLSAADLGSAYLGAFSFERLAAAGRVEELAEGAIARASGLFRTALPPWCPEPF